MDNENSSDDTDSGVSILSETTSYDEELHNVFIENMSNYNLAKSGSNNLLKIIPLLQKERIYSLILELDPGTLLEVIEFIPVKHISELLPIINLDKLRLITDAISIKDFYILSRNFEEKHITDIMFSLNNYKIILLYENNSRLRKVYISKIYYLLKFNFY